MYIVSSVSRHSSYDCPEQTELDLSLVIKDVFLELPAHRSQQRKEESVIPGSLVNVITYQWWDLR